MSPTETGQPPLPERISGLAAVATNLSWSWSRDARALFREVDEALWHLTRHNPIELLRRVDPARLAGCAQDPAFLKRYDALVEWNGFVAATHDTWFETSYPDLAPRVIAYFCAEFGLHASVPIYSGGLGVLAGDHCKSASDLGVPLVGVGLFYTKGYSDQRLRLDGWQEDAEERFDLAATPLEQVRGPHGDPCLATVRMFGRTVSIGASPAVPPTLRRRARSAAAPGVDSGSRRRAGVACPGLPPRGLAFERRARCLHAGRTGARARDGWNPIR